MKVKVRVSGVSCPLGKWGPVTEDANDTALA